jgi:hypothetical protein
VDKKIEDSLKKIGSSQSLTKTIRELNEFLDNNENLPISKKREFMYEKIADIAEKSLKLGFRRGHLNTLKKFRKTGKMPESLSVTRKEVLLAPGQKRNVKLRSKLSK